MTNDPQEPFTLSGWVIRHKYRAGVYLGRNQAPRNFPLLFESFAHAEAAINILPELMRPDWYIVGCAVEQISRVY